MDAKASGYGVTKKILDKFWGHISIDMEPKFLGRHLVMVISPTNKRPVKKQKENEKK